MYRTAGYYTVNMFRRMLEIQNKVRSDAALANATSLQDYFKDILEKTFGRRMPSKLTLEELTLLPTGVALLAHAVMRASGRVVDNLDLPMVDYTDLNYLTLEETIEHALAERVPVYPVSSGWDNSLFPVDLAMAMVFTLDKFNDLKKGMSIMRDDALRFVQHSLWTLQHEGHASLPQAHRTFLMHYLMTALNPDAPRSVVPARNELSVARVAPLLAVGIKDASQSTIWSIMGRKTRLVGNFLIQPYVPALPVVGGFTLTRGSSGAFSLFSKHYEDTITWSVEDQLAGADEVLDTPLVVPTAPVSSDGFIKWLMFAWGLDNLITPDDPSIHLEYVSESVGLRLVFPSAITQRTVFAQEPSEWYLSKTMTEADSIVTAPHEKLTADDFGLHLPLYKDRYIPFTDKARMYVVRLGNRALEAKDISLRTFFRNVDVLIKPAFSSFLLQPSQKLFEMRPDVVEYVAAEAGLTSAEKAQSALPISISYNAWYRRMLTGQGPSDERLRTVISGLVSPSVAI